MMTNEERAEQYRAAMRAALKEAAAKRVTK